MSHHIDPKSISSYLLGICNQLEVCFPDVRIKHNSLLIKKTLASSKKRFQKQALCRDNLLCFIDYYQESSAHDDLLFLALVVTGFYGLLKLGKMTMPDNVALIAALTKDMDCTIEIPVDPTLPELIKKPLKDIGPDLVSNLNLLAEFTHRSSDLTTWCVWIKSSIITADGTVIPPQDGSFADVNTIRPKWDRFRADCLIYHSIVRPPGIYGRYTTRLITFLDF
ncbi:hypothetical protein J132_11297 [Termitomyces sp. J132]|nr:hypothetical protein J132_11297 [Termitomyces sp. J132]